MGMAAGQARLLSITSRMSDNELRAQIINNNKMRLATESSQVSEAYVQALNEAQMMFTSYDANNNASYQQLTFNALTSYNQYNNQYILSNAAGNVLLSEKDAENYRRANGSVTEFLKAYGLEQTTSYFSGLTKYVDKSGLPFKTGSYDEDGNEIYGYLLGNKQNATASELTEYLQQMYEGKLGDTKLHPGYMTTKSSKDYNNYISALEDFQTKEDAYLTKIYNKMQEVFNDNFKVNNKSMTDLRNDITNAKSQSAMSLVFSNISLMVDEYSKYALTDESSTAYIKNIKDIIKENSGEYATTICNSKSEGVTRDVSDNTVTIKTKDEDEVFEFTKDSSGNNLSAKCTTKDDNDQPVEKVFDKQTKNADGTITLENADGDKVTFNMNLFKSGSDNWEVKSQTKNDLESMKKVANSVLDSLSKTFASVWDPKKDEFNCKDSTEYGAYIKAGTKLSEQVFGLNVGVDNYANLADIEWIKSVLDKGNINIGNVSNTISQDKIDAFQKIYDVHQLDCVMNTYGEPKYAWIDNNDPNQNGEAKAQWYENLFERIQTGGYKVLQDGLASSNEWIQFAFESGIVTMEQVDSNRNWQSLIYQNCSDITEQTNDAAVAKAEAEYKAAMNKIENKDKRFDLELKNIDTEHNSLQTEYDSIKTAIDKNIERTFKLYS